MRRHLLGLLEIPAIGQVDRDAGRPEDMTADFCPTPAITAPRTGKSNWKSVLLAADYGHSSLTFAFRRERATC